MMRLQKPYVIVWRITGSCQLACSFCAYSKELPFDRVRMPKEEILRMAAIWSEESKKSGRGYLVSYLGGEPFLHPDIQEMSYKIHQELGLMLSATTNGHPLKAPNLMQTVVDTFKEITFSIDGFENIHDTARKFPGSFKEIKKVIHTLKNAIQQKGKDLTIKVNTILMNGNYTQFYEFCEEMRSWGVDEMTFNQLGGNDRPEYYPENRLRSSQVDHLMETFPEFQKEQLNKGLRIHGSPSYLKRFYASANGIHIPIEECYPGSWFYFIDEFGKISPCSFSVNTYNEDIKNIQSVENWLNLPQHYSKMRLTYRAEICKDCLSTQVFDKFDVPEKVG